MVARLQGLAAVVFLALPAAFSLLVLCRRASLGADEISPELLLTMLWSVACRPACLRWCLLQRRRFACRGQHPSS